MLSYQGIIRMFEAHALIMRNAQGLKLNVIVAKNLEESRRKTSLLKIDYDFVEELRNAGLLKGIYSRIADIYKDSIIDGSEIDLQPFISAKIEHPLFENFLKILRDAKNGNKTIYFIAD
jgi:hypothetical protein